MATLVPKIIAPPNPWRTLTAMSRFVVGTIVMTKDAMVKTAIPYRKIFFLP